MEETQKLLIELTCIPKTNQQTQLGEFLKTYEGGIFTLILNQRTPFILDGELVNNE